MRRLLITTAAWLLAGATAAAGPVQFTYRIAPGQVWIATLASQTETTVMGQTDVSRSKTVIEYRVSDGPKTGWVSLTARIRSQTSASGDAGGQMDLSRITFTADMHTSGEIRNIMTEGSAMPPPDPNLPPEMKAMVAQSSNMIADAWKNAVFWFPEFPEYGLAPGDAFDMKRKLGMGGGGMGMQVQTLSKQEFELDDVAGGLAYFTVKDRSVTKIKGIAGGRSDTKTAGKGETVFDLQAGMWTDMTIQSRSKVDMGSMTGMSGMTQEVLTISRYEMERR